MNLVIFQIQLEGGWRTDFHYKKLLIPSIVELLFYYFLFDHFQLLFIRVISE